MSANAGNRYFQGFAKGELLALYRRMVQIRKAEEAIRDEYHPADEMRCPVHLCIGQEAVCSGVMAHATPEDHVFSSHRSHGYFLAKGGKMRELVAELYGKATGCNGGKAGSQEMSDPSIHFYSGAILGGTVPMAVGVAMAAVRRGQKTVAFSSFGDGAADEGIIYEALNFAALKKLPVIFLCENNGYATFSPQWKRQPIFNLAERARAFGVPSSRHYGNDVAGVSRVAKAAIERARNGEGPFFLEFDTYRYCGHVGPENDDLHEYRPPEEISAWKMRCPIEEFRGQLLGSGLACPEDLAKIDSEIDAEVADAFRFAKSSPFPEASALMSGLYAKENVTAPKFKEIAERTFAHDQSEAVPGPY